MTAPVVLVPGFWLGAWAWDEVVDRLRAANVDVTAVTLPGLASVEDDRSIVTMRDQVQAIRTAVEAHEAPAVLAVHSGAAVPGYGASDEIPGRIARMVYVDTGPPTAALDPDFSEVELPPPSIEQLAAEENLDGLSPEQLATFERRAIPEPAAALRELPDLRNGRRLEIPSTVICTGYTSEQYRLEIEGGATWLGALAELRDLTYVDLPTSHWPMWSRPDDLAQLLVEIANRADPP